MFEALPPRRGRRFKGALLSSVAVHALVLFLLLRTPQPVVVTRAPAVFGNHGTSERGLTYLPSPPTSYRKADSKVRSFTRAHLDTPRSQQTMPIKLPPRQLAQTQMAGNDTSPLRAGSPFGSALRGPTDYDERPALPVVFPDIPRNEIPPDAEGNVVVEIVIDAEGNVVDARVLESLGGLIDDAAIRTLRQWRFRPAVRNGVPIPSKQRAYFHLPH